ncbi:VOC family protein [Rhodovarius crocodyli]|uniref:VOC family protein n=1 Tax=Rhodovarius crocodyli TaxID=1979269 RepID=A0A437M2T9_9PROT|nr:VOC family protein [Rhodovarius crocodyli]RVT91834.1 VOC family protein [Rhodovarius crocodyli]
MKLPGIDHPLVLLRDIEAGRAFYASLGFTLTPVGKHPWGTSTSLAVLERSALELMGIYDESLIDAMDVGGFKFGRHMRDALAEREGIALIALHPGQGAAEDGEAMAAHGLPYQGHLGFRRKVKPPGRDWDEAVVSLGMLVDPALPRVSHFVAQQHKPELLWVPEWMQHANGATHIAAVTYWAPQPEAALNRLTAMFGPAVAVPGGHAVQTGQGVFRVLTDWAPEFGDAPRPNVVGPAAVNIDFAVPDLSKVAAVATIATPGGLAVPDIASAGNVLVRFVAA